MNERFPRRIALLALLALAVLLLRPVALEALNMPFGAHNSPVLEVVSAEGSQHCALIADCETVSVATVGLELARLAHLPVIGGIILAMAFAGTRTLRSWTALVPNPPPLSSLG